MGIYDRDYQRGNYGNDAPGFHLGGGMRSLTTNIVLFTVGVYLVQMLTRGQGNDAGWFTKLFSLHPDLVRKPWLAFELLTYGFLHDVWDVKHIIFNMVTFWFFGRSIESRYGRREYLAFYLLAIIAAGATWLTGEMLVNRQLAPVGAGMLGASGGISAVLLLFCLNYPRQMIYVWGVLPIPAWVFALLFVGQDIFGAGGHTFGADKNIAYTAHLGGALFAIMYYQFHWRIEPFLPGENWLHNLKPKPKLRVIDADSADESTEEQVDAILQKIQEHGRDSLTRKERRILEEASRQYQKRRH